MLHLSIQVRQGFFGSDLVLKHVCACNELETDLAKENFRPVPRSLAANSATALCSKAILFFPSHLYFAMLVVSVVCLGHIAVWWWPKTWLGSSPCVPGLNAIWEIDGDWLWFSAFKVDVNHWLNNQQINDRTIKTWLPERSISRHDCPNNQDMVDRTINTWLNKPLPEQPQH